MSQTNVEHRNVEVMQRNMAPIQGVDVAPFIRAALAGEAGDIPEPVARAFAGHFDLLDADFVIDTSGVDMPGFGVLHGVDGFRELWVRWIEDWEEYRWTHSNWAEVGNHVIVDAQITASGRGSGVVVTWTHCQVWTFRGGKLIRWSFFKDRNDGLETVGKTG